MCIYKCMCVCVVYLLNCICSVDEEIDTKQSIVSDLLPQLLLK